MGNVGSSPRRKQPKQASQTARTAWTAWTWRWVNGRPQPVPARATRKAPARPLFKPWRNDNFDDWIFNPDRVNSDNDNDAIVRRRRKTPPKTLPKTPPGRR
jgi:hypothetical protein